MKVKLDGKDFDIQKSIAKKYNITKNSELADLTPSTYDNLLKDMEESIKNIISKIKFKKFGFRNFN